jgi:hypothetical protein
VGRAFYFEEKMFVLIDKTSGNELSRHKSINTAISKKEKLELKAAINGEAIELTIECSLMSRVDNWNNR